MSNELQSSMPDPNSNTQLPEGSVPSSALLGGEVTTQFTFGKLEDYQAATEAAKLEQEAICGYALQAKSARQTHTQEFRNGQTVDVYEVFVTFAPAPPPPKPLPLDGTQA